ncbi:MAG: hypothetical protein VB066_11640 [Paludibacter sp.]|nr:hypothetical protein [Paludibacter sp.]
MKKYLFVALAFLFTMSGCDNVNDPEKTVKNEIIVKVYDTSGWNASTNKMDTTVGATVRLISDSTTLMATTGNNGIATFNNVEDNDYYIIATKGDKCNLINKTTIVNKTMGYLVVGVYSSVEDINNSPIDSSAVVGGPKLYDFNGDAIINNNDRVQGRFCSFEYQYVDVNGDGIINENDLLNGSLVKTDNQVTINVYLSNNNF